MIGSIELLLFLTFVGIYGLATIGQIKEGKHMYRALEAHFSLLKEAVIDTITTIPKYERGNRDLIRQNHQNLLDSMKSINVVELQKQFTDYLKNYSRFSACQKEVVTSSVAVM